jgi:ribonuclease-3
MNSERINDLKNFLAAASVCQGEITTDRLELYHLAFTHSSWIKEQYHDSGNESYRTDNERLEFLGDRVLNLIVAEYLFSRYEMNEGAMTGRMEVTRNRNLARIVRDLDCGFEELILIGTGQKKTPGIVADAFEAFIGALYLDCGFEETTQIVLDLIQEEIRSFSPERNYKKKLQEYLQKNRKPLPVYDLIDKSGPDHGPVFMYRVSVGDMVLGTGMGLTKAEATQNAAKSAFDLIKNEEI